MIYDALRSIQQELKAPKNQMNKFGGYPYRSCEDILTAVKPLLKKNDCVLTLSDEIVEVGNRVYVKATAKLLKDDTPQSIEVSAYARESETKKGMDDAQVTGSTSSYARKYALNGLFAIDDTKDADATNDHGKGQTNNAPPPNKQYTALKNAIDSCKTVEDLHKFKAINQKKLDALPVNDKEKLRDHYLQVEEILKREAA